KTGVPAPRSPLRLDVPEAQVEGEPLILDTTPGGVLFNEALPVDYAFVNTVADKKAISSIVNDLAERYPRAVVAASLDALKDVGYYWATRSGLTIAISDVATPLEKTEILDAYET